MTAGARYRRPLLIAFLLTTSFVAVEFIVGILSGSLALVSDAGHMLSDAGGLGMSLAAITLATGGQPPPTGPTAGTGWRSWPHSPTPCCCSGSRRTSSTRRSSGAGSDHEVASAPMIVVAVLGLVINLICFRLLQAGAKESLNLRGAYLEVVADAVGSVGVLIGAGIIALTRGTGSTR